MHQKLLCHLAGYIVVFRLLATMASIEVQHYAARLTDDLLVEIFSWLPIKSLARFSCVSKSWHAIISNQDYVGRKLAVMSGFLCASCPETFWHKYASDYVSMSCSQQDNSIDTALSFLPMQQSYHVVGTCNGLVLCTLCRTFPEDESPFFVCNPVTKRWSQIPQPTNRLFIEVLAFDRRLSPHYKLVLIYVSDNGHISDVGIFSSETGRWVDYNDCKEYDYPDHIRLGYDNTVYLHGNIHLLDDRKLVVVAFDIERRVSRAMELPCTGIDRERVLCMRLGQSAGILRCAAETNDEVLVWDLVDYDRKEWCLKHTIPLERFIKSYNGIPLSDITPSPHGIWADVEIVALHSDLDVIFLIVYGKLLIAYHLISSNITEVRPFKCRKQQYWNFYSYSPYYSEVSGL